MKNKTKYSIFAVLTAVLVCASLVLLLPIRHRATYEKGEVDMEAVYKFIFDIKAGNADGAEREALKLPLSGAGLKLVHRIITHIRKNDLTEEEITLISTFADENEANNTVAEIEKAAENEIKATAENNEKEESEAKKAFMRILDNSIRLEALHETPHKNIICLGRENMYAEIDKWEMFIRHLSYSCEVGERKLTEVECEERAVRFLLRNMPRRFSAKRPKCEYICETDGCDCFVITLGDVRTWVKIRCDTGNVTLFCGYGMELRV